MRSWTLRIVDPLVKRGQEGCDSFVSCLRAGEYLGAIDTLPWENVVGAVLVMVVGWFLSKLVVKGLEPAVATRFRRPSIIRTVLRSIWLAVLGVATLIASAVAGIQIGELVISVTVISAVLVVTLAPIVSSIINGLFVLADQPYEIGDMVELADTGQQGFVEDITIRYTKIFTLDNSFLVIPNSSIRNRDVVNYSAEDKRIRLSLQILVTYESDIDSARRHIELAARDVDEIIKGGPAIRIGSARYPAAPTCYIDQFADHGVLLTLRYWAREPYKQLTVRSNVQTRVQKRLADADVEFAYPHSHLIFDETSGQARVTVDRSERPDAGHRSEEVSADRTPEHGERGDGT